MAPSILIVGDHPSFRSTARMLLDLEGSTVVGEAPDGETAITQAERWAPTSRFRPRTPTRGCAPPRRSASAGPTSVSWCPSQYVEEGYALELVGGAGTGYLLDDRVGDIDRFVESVRRTLT